MSAVSCRLATNPISLCCRALEDSQPRSVAEAANETVSIQPEECDLHAVHELCGEARDGATAGLLENWIDQSQRQAGFSSKHTWLISHFI